MSTQKRPRLGSRENFYGVQEGEYDPGSPVGEGVAESGSTAASAAPSLDREEHIANKLLRSGPDAEFLCRNCLGSLPQETGPAVTLSEPEDYVEASEVELPGGDVVTLYSQHRRYRHCPRCAEIAEPVVLRDRPLEEFVTVVDEILDALGSFPSSRYDWLRKRAKARKQRGWSDQNNVAQLVRDLRTPLPEGGGA